MTEQLGLMLPPTQTTAVQPALCQGIQALAGQCDYAQRRDNVGFDATDTHFGHYLASIKPEQWTDSEHYYAFLIARKYAKQLERIGIGDIEDVPRPEKLSPRVTPRSKPEYAIKANAITAVTVHFPYDAQIVAAVKDLPRRGFDSLQKCWRVIMECPADASALMAFADHFGFTVHENAYKVIQAAMAAPDRAIEPKPAPPQPKVGLNGSKITFAFPYNPTLTSRLKQLGARWQPDAKHWTIDQTKVVAAYNFAKENGFDVSAIEQLRTQAESSAADLLAQRNQEHAQLVAALEGIDKPLPAGFAPYKHQVEAVFDMVLDDRRRKILAMDMGTGKTITALLAAQVYQRVFPDIKIIVIGPASLGENWMREAKAVGVTIWGYFSWAKVPPSFGAGRFVAIFDEAHAMQSLSSQRTKAALELSAQGNCVAAYYLTGTPLKNGRPINLFPLLRACQHSLAENRRAYEEYFCNGHYKSFGSREVWDTNGASHLDDLHRQAANVIIRRTKAQCLDLPPFTRIMHPVELTEAQTVAYRKLREEIAALYEQRKRNNSLTGAEAITALTRLRQFASEVKMEQAVAMAEEVAEQGGQAILFTAYQETAAKLATLLNCEKLTGETPISERQPMIDRFQAGQHKAIVMTVGAGGVGLNCQAANTVVMVDRPWTPGDAEQAEARAHRSGQVNAVTSYWLQAIETDHYIDAILLAKSERIELVLAGKRKTMRGTGGSAAEIAQEVLSTMFD